MGTSLVNRGGNATGTLVAVAGSDDFDFNSSSSTSLLLAMFTSSSSSSKAQLGQLFAGESLSRFCSTLLLLSAVDEFFVGVLGRPMIEGLSM